MCTFQNHFLFRWLLGMAVFLLIQEVFAPTQTQASCGDYVTYRSQSQGHEEMPVYPQPCSGPECHRRDSGDSFPFPFVPLPSTSPIPDVADVIGLSGSWDFASASHHPVSIHSKPIFRSRSIFHPPPMI